MRNLKYLSLILLVAGCSPAPERVFVDLDKIALTPELPIDVKSPTPSQSGALSVGSTSVPGEEAVEVENLRGDQKEKIRAEIERVTKSAIATIAERLQDYYQREIDEFYKEQVARIAPFKDQLNQDYLNKLRVIFEASAKKRGPLLTRFTFLTEFPPPALDEIVPLDGEDLTKREKAKREEIRELQRSIKEIDTAYENDVAALDAKNQDRLKDEAASILELVAQKKRDIDAKAENEATQLVRRFSSGLSQRIFSRYTFALKEIPTKTLNFPQIAAQPWVPGVPFDKVRFDRNDKATLAKQLEMFLNLKRYERSPEKVGARDVTAEFIEWRNNLKSGHWENWQKSSAPK